ncbi:MAG: metal ABC transporter permease [Bacteroides sp.]|nr:metal ABC transporter permease [Bacteroides sp.]
MDTIIFQYPFFQNALAAIIIIGIASAIIGTYVVTRRQVFIAGGITHTCFGGLGLGYFMGWNPIATAAIFAIAGALGVDALAAKRVRQDSAIAVIWAVGMALGILFVFMSSGFVPELNAFLFGNVLSITHSDLLIFSTFTIILSLFYILFYKRIVAISFDPDFAKTRRLPVKTLTTTMTILTALGIVLTIKLIGVMLLVSLLSLPQLAAENLTRRYRPMLTTSIIISTISSIAGLMTAYLLDVPASAAIVLLLTLIYGLTFLYHSN